MDEFLFGNHEDSNQRFKDISRKVKNGNCLKFILFYLSPGDYHRYHSAAFWATDFRRHIAGKLLPVKPSYVANHPQVFKENERVSLCGKWANGFFTTTFIGATNVGSIVVNFDKGLKTNTVHHQGNNVSDMLYTSPEFLDPTKISKNVLEFSTLRNDVTTTILDSHVTNVKDIQVNDFELDEPANSISSLSEFSTETENSSKNIKGNGEMDFESYLRDQKEMKIIEAENQQYPLTPTGFILEKGQEVGFFNLGSSIMLIFESPMEAEFEVNVGQKVRLGDNIIKSSGLY